MSRIFSPSDMPDTCDGSESPAELSSPSSSESEIREPEGSHSSTNEGKGKRRKYVSDPLERKRILEDDVWTTNVTPTSVDCIGCGKTIALDGRREYYLGLWEKHRDKCADIRRKKGQEPLRRKPRKSSTKRDADVSFLNTFNMPQQKQADMPKPDNSESSTASTSSGHRAQSAQSRASSADYLAESKHSSEQPHHLSVSRSMEFFRAGSPEQPGNEGYWQETPFAPPASNDSSQGRGVYRFSTRWELANGFGEYRAGFTDAPEEQAGGSNMRI